MSHESRMSIVRAIAAGRRLAIPEAVLSCLSMTRDQSESFRLMRKFANYVSEKDMTASAIRGLTNNPSLKQRDVAQAVVWFKSLHAQDPSHETILDLSRILAIHGIDESASNLADLIKRSLNPRDSGEALLILQIFRKIKSERKWLWDIYLSMQVDDSKEVTDVMSTILAVNGWHDRVSLVLDRVSGKLRSSETAARFIRALSHHALGPEYVDLVWRIVSLTEEGGIRSVAVREAVAGFYLANSQFRAIVQLIEKAGPIDDDRVAQRILKKVEDEDIFVQLFSLMKNIIDDSSSSKALDLCLQRRIPSRLIEVLDIMYVRKIRLVPVMESRIRELAEDRSVTSIPQRKRIYSLIDLFNREQVFLS